jgi:RHS repeat-associated protein
MMWPASRYDVASEEFAFYANNHIGTPLIMAKYKNATGPVLWEADYKPFGEAKVYPKSAETNNFRLPGQYYDEETSLYYNYNRYYDPKTGRYLKPDPVGLLGGTNLFVYAQNNPVNLIDPYGLFIWGAHGNASGGVIAAIDGTAALLVKGLFNDIGLEADISGSFGPQITADLGAGFVIAPFADCISDLGGESMKINLRAFIGIDISIPDANPWDFAVSVDLIPGFDFGLGFGAGWAWLFGEDGGE